MRFSRKRQADLSQIFFQYLGVNTCSLQPALKSNAPSLLKKLKMRLAIFDLWDSSGNSMIQEKNLKKRKKYLAQNKIT